MNFFEATFDANHLLLGQEKRPFIMPEELRRRLPEKGSKELIMGIRPEYLEFLQEKPAVEAGYIPVSIFSTEQIGEYNIFSFRIDGSIFHGMNVKGKEISKDGFVRLELDKIRFFEKTTGKAIPIL